MSEDDSQKLKREIEERGYTKVSVKIYSKSFRIHYESPEFSATRNCLFPISRITRTWFLTSFPKVE